MEENKKTPAPSWKGCIIFGLVVVALVLLATKLKVVLFSAALILLIVAGIVTSAKSVAEDWKEGFKVSAAGCVIGLLLNCLAAVLYVIGIVSPFVEIIARLKK
ncbi:MAG: hypothetical protein IKZ39_07815 [Lachnospiraceae bacterium]|nr:hypothetical protein [Lachnospiraceae bacterium]